MDCNDHCTNFLADSFTCALCHEEFNSEPFKLVCGSIICKNHLDSFDYGEPFSCLVCGIDHNFEESFDLSYKKDILIPNLKKKVSEMKQRLKFYESVYQNPVKFLNSSLLELKDKVSQRKIELKTILKKHCEQSVSIATKEEIETSSLRNHCTKLNSFSNELEKFTQYLKTNQNFYIYYVYGQKLKLVSKILERKIQKMKYDIQIKISESLLFEKTNIPELLAVAFGKIDIKANKENLLLSKDINGQIKVWSLENLKCLYTINLCQYKEFYLNFFSKDLDIIFNEEKNPNILLNIYSHLINDTKINLKNETISYSKVLKIKTLKKKNCINCLLVVTEKAKVIIYDVRKSDQEMPAIDIFDLTNECSKLIQPCSLNYFDQGLYFLLACSFFDGNIVLLKISKKNKLFDMSENCQQSQEVFKYWLQAHSTPVIYLKFKKNTCFSKSTEEIMLVSASSDGLVRKWIQVCENSFEFELKKEINCSLFSVCELLSENKIAIGQTNGTISIIDFDNNKLLEIKAHSRKIKCIISNSLSDLITASEDKYIKVWNSKTGTCISSFFSHFDPISSIELIEMNDFKELINKNRIEAKISQLSVERLKKGESISQNFIN